MAGFPTDIEIAHGAKLKPISEIAKELGVEDDELELYGRYKAKINDSFIKRKQSSPDGKLILVTAINPTPAGEGKTTTTVGLGQAMTKIGKKAIIALREPSLGPVFGIKGGAAGGGYAQVVPMEDINLHFTGDFHAITAANNLLSAVIDNHLQQGNELGIDPRRILFSRVLDMNDRVLRNVVVGLGVKNDGIVREDHFMITVASEIMAILCLAESISDLKERLGNILHFQQNILFHFVSSLACVSVSHDTERSTPTFLLFDAQRFISRLIGKGQLPPNATAARM